MRICFVLNAVPWFDPVDSRLWGGSEEAVVGLAQALARSPRNHDVAVFSDFAWVTHIDGVTYLPRGRVPKTDADALVFVKHRARDHQVSCLRTYLWSCDPDEAIEPDEFDRVVALSEWHARELRGLSSRYPPERVVAVPLGLSAKFLRAAKDAEMEDRPRDPARLVYASSFDRGLEVLLRAWPRIKSAVPAARLDVWYGWAIWDAIYGGRPPPAQVRWRREVEQLLRQDGVSEMGRLEDPSDPRPFLDASVWAYPCTGGERFCLTGQKAQALGCVPVVRPTMALDETVRFGRTIKNPLDYVDGLVDAMLSPDWQRAERGRMLREFSPHSWAGVAERWEREVLA